MKKLSSILMIATAGLLFQACNSTPKDSTAAADSVNKVKDTTTTGQTGIAVVADDAKFAVDAANGGMTEIELSKLALERATNAKVKEFANMMVMDHSKAGEELKGIAKTKNITLPDSVNADSKKAIADLSAKKAGADFDKAYVDKMVSDHKATVDMFESESKNSKDADLKAFADKTLPVIKGHLEHINAIHDGMK
jgi:putative membrane protein